MAAGENFNLLLDSCVCFCQRPPAAKSSQEPHQAQAWRRRREENDLAAAADPQVKKHRVDEFDLKNLIAAEDLHTEDIRCMRKRGHKPHLQYV